MPLTCPSPASHAEEARHDADGDHGTSAGGENSAVGGIGKACSLCEEIKPARKRFREETMGNPGPQKEVQSMCGGRDK